MGLLFRDEPLIQMFVSCMFMPPITLNPSQFDIEQEG